MGARLIGQLPAFLAQSIPPEQAQEIVRGRLKRRSEAFLDLLRHGVFSQPDGPYGRLMKHAGCEYGDIQEVVGKKGVEQALIDLYRQGVYLTSHEFSGRCPVVRGPTSFAINPRLLRNPLARRHVPVRSSGSRSSGTPVHMDLAFFRDTAVDTVLYLDARRSVSSAKAIWEVPGGVALYRMLTLSCSGRPPARWFSQLDVRSREMSRRYRESARVLKLGGLLAGVPMPPAEYVSLEDPLPIIQWMTECLRDGRTPHLFTFASSAVRLCRYAYDAGIDLQGVQITMSGEPTTQARLDTVRRSHVEAFPAMGSAECGYIGYGCLTPEAPDDMHLLTDLHAVIQPGPGESPSPLEPHALLVSSLRPTAPITMLNVSLGDTALMTRRTCGCLLGSCGLDTHLQYIRSVEKLTSSGMALFDSDVVSILEQDLPRRFGGTPTDYQLIESAHDDGGPCLRLIVHPRIGPLSEREVKSVFLEAVASQHGAERLTSLVWRAGDVVSVERDIPRTTSTGKIQHVHVERRKE